VGEVDAVDDAIRVEVGAVPERVCTASKARVQGIVKSVE
jgi:hypothetical protein